MEALKVTLQISELNIRSSSASSNKLQACIYSIINVGTFIEGEELMYTNWDENTPTPPTTAGQQCAILSRDVDGRWMNVDCQLTKRFVCEYTAFYLLTLTYLFTYFKNAPFDDVYSAFNLS